MVDNDKGAREQLFHLNSELEPIELSNESTKILFWKISPVLISKSYFRTLFGELELFGEY